MDGVFKNTLEQILEAAILTHMDCMDFSSLIVMISFKFLLMQLQQKDFVITGCYLG
jgi:hypothetical protein